MSEVTQGLRELADFLDAHPDVKLNDPSNTVYVGSRDMLAEIARIGGWRKVYSDGYFSLVRDFAGGVRLDVFTDRSTVCRKVVTGTRVIPAKDEHIEETYEWVCDEPLLAGAL